MLFPAQSPYSQPPLTEPFTFVLPGEDLSLFPQVKGGKDMGSNAD